MDLLLTKYLKAGISYQGIQRFETFPVPEAALREAVLNAIIHKDYSSGTPIQISVYADKLMLWNPGELPLDWTVAKLKGKHPSQPFNPDVANVFFRAGMIEAWGRGIERIMESCRAAGIPEAVLRYERTGLWIEFVFPAAAQVSSVETMEKMTEKMTEKTSDQILAQLRAYGSLSMAGIAKRIGKSPSTVERAIRQLRHAGKLMRVGPDKGGHWEVRADSP
jgi:ATP-dependent DNA helicase RecG